MKRWSKRYGGWNYRITGIVAGVLVLLFLLGLYETQVILLANAQELGNELAGRYAEEELHDVHTAQSLLTLGVYLLEDQVDAGASWEEQEQWVENFCRKVAEMADGTGLRPFGVIQGIPVAAVPLEEKSADDMLEAAWYRQALQSQGEMVFGEAPSDAQMGHGVITIAQKCRNIDNVLAFDIYLDDYASESMDSSLPGGSSYFLCDAEDNLLYARTQLQAAPEELENYLGRILGQIRDGRLDDAQEYIYDLTSEKRAVYFNTAENGWVSIITIPYSALLGELRQVFYWAVAIFAGLALLLIFMGIRAYRGQKKMARANETVVALGNLYYSIYRVNASQGTYETVKGAADIIHKIPAQGPYDRLLEVIGQVIDQDTFIEFKTSFSLENIRHLMDENISDFGGDFRRLFGEEYRWVNVRLLFDASLQHDEAILCFRQVEEEKERQLRQLQVLEHALDRARESEAARGQFFSQMSHDMRTPLNVMIGNAQLAQQKEDDREKVDECLKKIEVSAGHLLELINDILEMSRMEHTDLHLKNDQFDLQDTVEQCLSAFQAQAELQQKTLEVSFSLTHRKVCGDAFRLQQVLNNLVSNAMKFTRQGDTIGVEVSQPRRQEPGICCIVVRDTGIGMSEEFLPKLFTPYARESRFGTQTVLGTGLGMTIVESIVSRMGGQIQVESKLGEGTVFTLTLPLEPVQEEVPQLAQETSEDPKEVLGGKHILLAEDFEMNLEIATELLKLCGAQVTPAQNGQEAVEQFRTSEPGYFDAILMDMNMPVMDGCAATAAIRAMDRKDAATVPILAVTANASAEDVSATARAGMNAHITKPIDMRQLARTLRRLEKTQETT